MLIEAINNFVDRFSASHVPISQYSYIHDFSTQLRRACLSIERSNHDIFFVYLRQFPMQLTTIVIKLFGLIPGGYPSASAGRKQYSYKKKSVIINDTKGLINRFNVHLSFWRDQFKL